MKFVMIFVKTYANICLLLSLLFNDNYENIVIQFE